MEWLDVVTDAQEWMKKAKDSNSLAVKAIIAAALLGMGMLYYMSRWDEENYAARYACDIVMRIAPHYENDDAVRNQFDALIRDPSPPPNTRQIGVEEAVQACENESREFRELRIRINQDPPF